VDIFIEELEVYGHHGVGREEKVLGQRLLYDVRLTIDDCRAAQTDQVSDTVDYTEVLDLIV
jgi:dihydroneopterin aldolase